MKKWVWLFFVVCLGFAAVTVYRQYVEQLEQQRVKEELQKQQEQEQDRQRELQRMKIADQRIKEKAAEALAYAKEHGYDLKHAILVDFSIHSGKKRFFVWNHEKNAVEISSLVAHGYGNEEFRSTTSNIVFSNIEGSLASSLGKYRLGVRSYSKWGINVHYKLHGLESTNDNAFKRVVVLHSYEYVPENELFPLHLPLGYSQGCPVIDNNTMKQVDELLKTKSKPVLFWIYQ